jgi:heptosyltransferase-2
MKKILVTPLVGMGDTLMTTPALSLLKSRFPDSKITCVTLNRASHDILSGNPHIDRLDYFPLTSAGFLRGVSHILARYALKHDISITFYPSNRAAYNLFAALSLCRVRIGHRYLHSDYSQLNWLKNRTDIEDTVTHCVVKNVRLLAHIDKAFSSDADPEKIPPARIYLTEKELSYARNYRKSSDAVTCVGIHAGTSVFKGHAKRRWPAEKFASLIDSMSDIKFLLFGTAEDDDANNAIMANVKNRLQVTRVSTSTIREAAAVIGTLDAFVTNDSGLMHVAAAMGTPVAAILGPTNPAFIHPWKVSHCIVRTKLPCSPCFYYSPVPLICRLDGSYRCLTELPVDDVRRALESLL